MEIGPLHLKVGMFREPHAQEKIASRTARAPGTALARQADALSLAHTGGIFT